MAQKTLLQNTQKTEMVFVEARKWQKTETSNPLTFITVADKTSYERFEVMATPDCNLEGIENNTPCNVVFALGNYNNRASLQVAALLKK